VRLGKKMRIYAEIHTWGYLDAKEDNPTELRELPEEGFVLLPGIGYLLHTEERVRTDRYVPIIDGKSSIGRLFVTVHVTAGFGDPGFDGQYTLETTVTHPVKVYPGMRITQMRFHTIAGEVGLYEGNYTGEGAKGPVASRSFKQFAAK
jgi:dCTP deaminase